MLHPESVQSCRCEKRCVISLCLQLPHPCLDISPDSAKCASRIQLLHLDHPPSARRPDHRLLRELLKPRTVQNHISWIFPSAVSKDREIRIFLHRHIFQAVHGNIDPAVHKRPVQFFYEQPLAANLFQTLIQYFISGRFHRDDLNRDPGIKAHNLIPDDFRLPHCKLTLSAADLYHRLHGASFPFSMI